MLSHPKATGMTKIIPLEYLKYNSKDDAVRDLANAGGVFEVELKNLTYWVPGKRPRMDGHPYLIGHAVINEYSNECMKGYINLVTGRSKTWKDACVVF